MSAGSSSASGGSGAAAILCVYGVPPTMPLQNVAGQKIGQSFTLTRGNKASFERALKIALAGFVGGDASIMSARFVFVRNVADISAAVRSGAYTQVVYYGHADQTANALIPAPHVRVTAAELASALAGTTVRHVDILGCRSTSFAAELATLAPRLRVGHLGAKRIDNVEVNLHTQQVVNIAIDRQPLLHFGNK